MFGLVFGLVRRSSLVRAEKRLIEEKVIRISLEERVKDLQGELELQRGLRIAAEAETARLGAILIAHPVEPAEPEPAPQKAEPAEPEPVRVLSGFEVVARATLHRNTHHRAAQAK